MRIRHVSQAVLLASVILGGALGAHAQDASISNGCQSIQNAPDAANSAQSSFLAEDLFANEVVSASVEAAAGGTGANLEVDGSVVDSTTLPGTLSWVVPADGTYDVIFRTTPSGSGAYYDFDCTAVPAGGGGNGALGIPAMPWYGIVFTILGLAGLAARKLRR